MSILGTTDVSPNIEGFYNATQLMRAVPELCYAKYATEQKKLPARSGTKITFHRWSSLPAATTPLSSTGETPSPSIPSISRPTCEVHEYGGYIPIATYLTLVGPDAYLAEAAELNGEQQGLTWDTLDRAIVTAGTTVRYSNAQSARTSVATAPLLIDVKSMIRTLRGNKAKPLTAMIQGGPKISTTPIPAGYRVITHTDAQQDWEDIAGFTPAEKYANQRDAQPNEIGQIKGLRVEVTTNAKVWVDSGASVGSTGLISTSASQVDVYASIVFARGGYGTVALTEETSQNIVTKPSDPLKQRMTSGWKGIHGGLIPNQDFLLRLEHGCTSY